MGLFKPQGQGKEIEKVVEPSKESLLSYYFSVPQLARSHHYAFQFATSSG